ncbi:MAG TPA: class I SAM-dependent methyltransferase [Nocardioidaceae bacterium]|nr:class I SAM-dependent methyltransferase [Nocardioidaceae bacterium]
MGWWTDHAVPRLADRALDVDRIHELRARVCDGLAGDVVEIGFGSGLNARHYPAAVDRVAAVEPSDVAWRMARRNIARTRAPVERAGLDGQALDLGTASCDGALSTFTMCTIPDLDAALRETVRVLRPGGVLHFVEHGLAPDPGVARWQHRLQPIQGRVAGGCHLDRPIRAYVERSGLVLEQLDTFYGMGPKPFGYLYLGRAVKRA